MQQYTNLFVVIDPDNEQQPALSRAIDIARRSKKATTLTLFLATFDFSYEMTSILSGEDRETMQASVLNQRKEWLSNIIKQQDTDGINIKTSVVWHNRPYESMIEQIIENKHDLLIKNTHQHIKLGSILFTPTDWQLIRKCPCPVLLVKDQGWPINGKILVAVNVSSENETHEALNDKLIEEANSMAAMLNAEVYLVNAYPTMPVNVTIELPEFDPASCTDVVRGHHLIAMKALRQKHGIDEKNTFCQEGLAEVLIPHIASEINAEQVIIGSTGRTGLSAMFLGNTAEHTVDHLNCDVLAIKPDGYVSPLDPDDENDE